MPDISYTLKGTVRRNAVDAVYGKGEAANLKVLTITRSATARTANDTLKFIRLPSNARIHGLSKVYWDDLASTGSPTLDMGVGSVDSNITSDPDALTDGLDIAAAAGSAALIKDHANYGKQLWEYVSGQTTDPGGMLDIYGSFVDANTNTTGDVTLEVVFSFD